MNGSQLALHVGKQVLLLGKGLQVRSTEISTQMAGLCCRTCVKSVAKLNFLCVTKLRKSSYGALKCAIYCQ